MLKSIERKRFTKCNTGSAAAAALKSVFAHQSRLSASLCCQQWVKPKMRIHHHTPFHPFCVISRKELSHGFGQKITNCRSKSRSRSRFSLQDFFILTKARLCQYLNNGNCLKSVLYNLGISNAYAHALSTRVSEREKLSVNKAFIVLLSQHNMWQLSLSKQNLTKTSS